MNEVDYRMYILINTDLKMGKGKIAAQAGHGVQFVTERMIKSEPQLWKKYKASGMRKIVLKATQQLMMDMYLKYGSSNISWCKDVIDAGHTQVSYGSFTALVFKPMSKIHSPPELCELKLL